MAERRLQSLLRWGRLGSLSPYGDLGLGLAAGLLCLALYLRTIAPGILGGDAGELQFVPYILGLAHPTGYPLHTLLGKLWASLLPVGSVAWRMNLLSSLAAAAGVGLVYATVRRLGGGRLAALGAALALGVSQVYWGQALTADKYALTACLTALVLWALVRWSQGSQERHLGTVAFALGLGLAHHRSLLVFLPLLGAYALWRDRRLRGDARYALEVGALFLGPLLLYLWLPVGASRGLPPGTWRPTSLGGWLTYLQDRGFLGAVRPWAHPAQNLAVYGRTLLAQFTALGVALGLAGLAHQLRTRRALAVTLAAGFALQAGLSAGYQVPRQWVFFLPSFVIYALWLGEGLGWLWTLALGWARRGAGAGYAATALVAALSLVLVAAPLWHNYPAYRLDHLDGGTSDLWRNDLKSGYRAERLARWSLAAVEPGAIIACDWEQATPLWYLQQVEGQRADVTVMYPIERWQEALTSGRPTYLARTLSGVGEAYRLSAAGPLVRVRAEADHELPPDAEAAAIRWQDRVELAGYRLHNRDMRLGYVLGVSLYFRARQPLTERYSLSLRLFAEDGTKVWAEDRQDPALGMYPTTRWLEGEVVGDYFEVPLGRHVPAGRYRLGIIVYTTQAGGGWRDLPLSGSEETVGYLPAVDVPPRR